MHAYKYTCGHYTFLLTICESKLCNYSKKRRVAVISMIIIIIEQKITFLGIPTPLIRDEEVEAVST